MCLLYLSIFSVTSFEACPSPAIIAVFSVLQYKNMKFTSYPSFYMYIIWMKAHKSSKNCLKRTGTVQKSVWLLIESLILTQVGSCVLGLPHKTWGTKGPPCLTPSPSHKLLQFWVHKTSKTKFQNVHVPVLVNTHIC